MKRRVLGSVTSSSPARLRPAAIAGGLRSASSGARAEPKTHGRERELELERGRTLAVGLDPTRTRSRAIALECAKDGMRPWYPDLRVWEVEQLEDLLLAVQFELDLREAELLREEVEREAKTVVSSRFVQEYVRCNKPKCGRCARGEYAHGPYWFEVQTFGNGRRKKLYRGKKRPRGARS